MNNRNQNNLNNNKREYRQPTRNLNNNINNQNYHNSNNSSFNPNNNYYANTRDYYHFKSQYPYNYMNAYNVGYQPMPNIHNQKVNPNNWYDDKETEEIVVKDVSKTIKTASYKAEILKDINLTINKGEIVIILGPSGSGKTTLLNVIAGIDEPTTGEIIIKNSTINTLNDKELTEFRRNHIAYIYQRYGLVPISTVWDNIKLGQNLVPKKKRTVDIEEVIDIVGIRKLINKFPHELSGGQKQRVAIARAIMKQPEIMLCDEPTGALDDETSKNIIDLFLKVNKEFNTTIVMVTHNNSLVSIATKIIHIQDGKVVKIENKRKKQK